jgi:zinc transporter ZupT
VIVSHKGVEAFAVSFNFSEGQLNKKALFVILFYGAMTPIGAVLALVARSLVSGRAALLTESILEAFATGTFLYVH